MYKGYKVKEIVLHDYASPDVILVVDCDCGCNQCEELNEVQPRHSQCGLLPENLRNDKNVFPRLADSGWVAEFLGDYPHVDEWLD